MSGMDIWDAAKRMAEALGKAIEACNLRCAKPFGGVAIDDMRDDGRVDETVSKTQQRKTGGDGYSFQ